MRELRPRRALAALCTLVLLGGCATATDPVAQSYGDAVRHMIDAQIHDRAAAQSPASDPVVGLDGERGAAVLKAHRGDVSKPADVQHEITLGIGE
jgi:hypothetical protein